jgi:hypothetical protein
MKRSSVDVAASGDVRMRVRGRAECSADGTDAAPGKKNPEAKRDERTGTGRDWIHHRWS